MALFQSGRGTYNIQTLKDTRWVTDAVRHWEGEAKEHAEKLLGNKKCGGVRVVLEDPNGFEDGDEVVFEKRQEVSAKKALRIKTIETPPAVCKTPRDFFSLESRMIMNVMFRDYLEKVMLTPTEVLHIHREFQRLTETDNLLMSGVDNIARLQLKQTGQELRQRRDEIHGVVEQMEAQARRAADTKLPKIGGTFSKLLKQVEGLADETPEYLAMVALSRDLIGRRNWIGKLDRLVELAKAEKPRSRSMLLLDTVIADVLGANVVQELLGWQPSLGSAIIGMLDLAQGDFAPEKGELSGAAATLNELMKNGSLPASANALIDRAIRQLHSPHPLYQADPSKEMEEYQRILVKLLVPGGILSGAKAAEAITVRGARFIEQGGASGRRTAINATLKALPDRARGVMYLSELSNTSLADDHLDDIVRQLDTVFSTRVIDELCRRSMSPKDRMVTVTGAYKAAVGSTLPGDLRERVADHIDGVLERYLIDENIIDKLDSPDAHIRDRAVRLVKFCSAGVLPEGKALTRARKRIVQLLKQPNFESKFIEGLSDTTIAERALREFHKLLTEARLA